MNMFINWKIVERAENVHISQRIKNHKHARCLLCYNPPLYTSLLSIHHIYYYTYLANALIFVGFTRFKFPYSQGLFICFTITYLAHNRYFNYIAAERNK